MTKEVQHALVQLVERALERPREEQERWLLEHCPPEHHPAAQRHLQRAMGTAEDDELKTLKLVAAAARASRSTP